MSEYTCRIDGCQDSFDTWNGRNSHEGQIHGGITYKFDCKNCGKEFERDNPKKDKEDGRFCKSDCYYEYQRNENRVGIKCKQCGEIFKVLKHKAKDRKFCGKPCAVAYQKIFHTGKNHGNYKHDAERVIECNWCGNDFRVTPALVDERKFCSEDCFHNWRSETLVGGRHHSYKGGSESFYGSNWNEARKETFKVKGEECINCGISRIEHKKVYGMDLHIDHIKPLKKCLDDGMGYEEANRIDNLRPLCISCHNKLENG